MSGRSCHALVMVACGGEGSIDNQVADDPFNGSICWLNQRKDRAMKLLSEQLKQDHESGDFGKALDGYSERAAALENEVEQLRVQLAGCGVMSKCNTETSRAKQTCKPGDYGWSQSFQDVSDAIDREIKLRHALDVIHDYTVRHHGGILGRLHEICDSALGHDK
jgi:hypothetical protein